MKFQKLIAKGGIFVLVVFFMIAGNCFADQKPDDKTTADELGQDVKDALNALKDYSADKRDEALKKGKSAVDALDDRIEKLEDNARKKWGEMDQAAREKTQDTLKSLRKGRNELAEWYGGMKQSSADAWEHVKEGFLESYDTLSKTYYKAVKEF
ncbi:MAG: hypothetical protein R6U13_08570 [Desulfatiglandaceae bacterium]